MFLGLSTPLPLLLACRLGHIARVIDFHEDSAVVMLTHAIFKSADVLAAILFAFAVVGAFLSTTIFLCEAGAWSETLAAFVRPGDSQATPFASVPHAMWWTVETATSVGYGGTCAVTLTVPCMWL